MADYYKYPLWNQNRNPSNDGETKQSGEISIDELEKQMLSCNQCPLRKDCIAPTSYNGNSGSPLMLVAEGPGGVEDEYGVPLVGKSGQLLDKALWSAGISRDRIYTSNVVKCRPLSNRTPSIEEGVFCGSRWLENEIRILKPKVILCLGSVSMRFFGGNQLKITKDRGHWLDNRFGLHIIATYHPAYLIRLGGEQLKTAKWHTYYDITAAKNKALEYFPEYSFNSGEITPLLNIYSDRKTYRENHYPRPTK